MLQTRLTIDTPLRLCSGRIAARYGKMSPKSVKLVRSQGLTAIIYVKVFPHWSLSNGYRLDLRVYQLDRKSEGSFVSYLYHHMVYLIQTCAVKPVIPIVDYQTRKFVYFKELIRVIQRSGSPLRDLKNRLKS